jgi:hypothetical protein
VDGIATAARRILGPRVTSTCRALLTAVRYGFENLLKARMGAKIRQERIPAQVSLTIVAHSNRAIQPCQRGLCIT